MIYANIRTSPNNQGEQMSSNNSNILWYSSLSTRIFDIDTQHGNIDMLIQLFEHGDTQSLKQDLSHLLKAIEQHFSFEENLLGDAFPEEHTNAHNKMILWFEKEVTFLQTGVISREIFTSVLRSNLISHVENFDVQLKQLLNS